MRQAGFYWVLHRARTEKEVAYWNMPSGYWSFVDSRTHFTDDDCTFIGERVVEPPEEQINPFGKWRDPSGADPDMKWAVKLADELLKQLEAPLGH